ncbi:hypothetical protein BKA70DRAFT_1196107 [Coprinopsis sp. MPI-PUGE-AT-0042]|nr:hypothetical protein BKA70DRAFT_1196107 [Coprinopsis sp. MPI-PUGE-AT-0042]
MSALPVPPSVSEKPSRPHPNTPYYKRCPPPHITLPLPLFVLAEEAEMQYRLPFQDEKPQRTHWIDNLRTTLTVLFILQHAIVETTTSASSTSPPPFLRSLDLFVVLCKTILPGLFFFVSGYTSALWRTPGSRSRSDGNFIWKRTLRLFLPAVLYGTIGHLMLWMILTKRWPQFFHSPSIGQVGGGGTLVWTFGRLEGPVVYLVFLYILDLVFVCLSPSRPLQPQLPCTPPRKTRGNRHSRSAPPPITITNRQWFLFLAGIIITLSTWTFASASMGWTQKPLSVFPVSIAAYDTISPAAPLQHIVAYIAGIWFFKHPQSMMIPTRPAFAALVAFSTLSLAALHLSCGWHPETPQSFAPNPIGLDTGMNFPTLPYAIWTTCSFVGISLPLISLFAQWNFTRRDWGTISQCSYTCIWVHMIPVIVFSRLVAGDGSRITGEWIGLGRGRWEGFILVAAGSIVSSWGVGLLWNGLVGWSNHRRHTRNESSLDLFYSRV